MIAYILGKHIAGHNNILQDDIHIRETYCKMIVYILGKYIAG